MTNHCPTCQQLVEAEVLPCPSCRTPYHTACYRSTRCVVPGCMGLPQTALPQSAPPQSGQCAAAAAGLTFSEKWGWATKVNLVVAAVLVASLLRQIKRGHLVPEGIFGLLGFFLALASAVGTYQACSEDLNQHAPPGGTLRPDHYGSMAWMTYMAGVIALYLGLFTLFIPFVQIIAIPAAFLFALPCFAIGWCISLFAVFADARKLRAALGLPFPLVAMMMSGIALSPLTGQAGAGRERANTRACYANQKTIVGAVEMYNLDWQGKRPKLEHLDEHTFAVLKSGGYLQSIPQDPGQGAGTSGNFMMMNTGNGVGCKVHGTIQ